MPRKTIAPHLINMLLAATGSNSIDYSLWSNNFITDLRDVGYTHAWEKYQQSLMELQQVIMNTPEGRESLKRVMPPDMYKDLLQEVIDNNSPEVDFDNPNHQNILVRLACLQEVEGDINRVWESDGDNKKDLRRLIHQEFGFDFTEFGEMRMKTFLEDIKWMYDNLDSFQYIPQQKGKRSGVNQ